MDLSGKVIVITGAARGIGRALAEDFAACGANLALIDLKAEDMADTAAACSARSVQVRTYSASVSSEPDVIETFTRIAQDFGRIDGLVNNAGILRDALLVKAKDGAILSRMTLDQWQSVIDVNLTGVFLCAREAAEQMIKSGHGGVIVNISSISRAGNVGQSNYSAAKAGVDALTVVWARELARFGIRVGAIAPGFTRTSILDSMRPDMLEKLLAPVPLRRLAQASEIAQATRFIFQNDYFTGRTLELDGGLRL